jgi:lipoprotein-anchoring transpeptidase ErfK/SrfK
MAGLIVAVATGAAAQAPARRHAKVVHDIVALQVLLDRAGFSPGEIDGRPGKNTRAALDAYRRALGLDATSPLPAASAPPLREHTLTHDDVSGPFIAALPGDMMAKATLPALGYTGPLEAIAERFHASPALLRTLNPAARFTAGDTIVVPNVENPEPLPPPSKPASAAPPASSRNTPIGTAGRPIRDPGVRIVVSSQTSGLTVESDEGRVLFFAPVTLGSVHDPLPIGTWKVTGVQRNPIFHYNPDLFWDADPAHARAKIAPGPNNPVGVAWIDLSKEHFGIHGTPEPGRIGYTESHGCVRLTNWDVLRVAALVTTGTPVIFR